MHDRAELVGRQVADKPAITRPNVPRLRLSNQGLSRPALEKPRDVVEWLCAVQAQDYLASKWALGTRMRKATDDDVERAFNAGSILRTHLLRPTWHFVLPADIGWLLALTAPRVRAAVAPRHRQLEIDSATVRRANRALVKGLRDGQQLTRHELRTILGDAGVATDEQRMSHIMMRAELDGIVCSGARRGKQYTYALLDRQAPESRILTRDQALAELASRYFASRGPATVQDFAWWSGQTLASAREGLEAVKARLVRARIGGRDYWFRDASRTSLAAPSAARSPRAHLLSIFDEYMSAYTDRSAIIGSKEAWKLWGKGSAFNAVIVLDGKIVGTWKRSRRAKEVLIETRHFTPPSESARKAVAAAARRYGDFLGLPVVLR